MKKLVKLNINQGNLIKDEELQKLRGGWSGLCAVHWNGVFQFNKEWLCYGDYGWQCDESCAAPYRLSHPDAYCFCNFPY
jgi:hypothetical protein